MTKPRISVHWFRRDLRLHDNHGLYRALADHGEVLPLFIFDTAILDRLEVRSDRRVDLIHRTLDGIRKRLTEFGSALIVEHGEPIEVWPRILERYDVIGVTANHDHEPYAVQRDAMVRDLLEASGIRFKTYKDISIFERAELMKDDGTAYTVYSAYMRKWRARFHERMTDPFPSERMSDRFHRITPLPFPSLEDISFESTDLHIEMVPPSEELLVNYEHSRDEPAVAGTSQMSTHLRFGTVSVRELVRKAFHVSPTYVNELIWREFFMQILWNFPHPDLAFKRAYDRIDWRNSESDFEAWCTGCTGYPLVDAGMRELEATGLMHNRVRMVVASFLCKHLLIDWRWGEAWFAAKLLDFELSSNNGNWQWASGSGCDAAPYFRIFNPTLQLQRFDPGLKYVKRWVPEYGTANYVQPVVVHDVARARALIAYKAALSGVEASIDNKNE